MLCAIRESIGFAFLAVALVSSCTKPDMVPSPPIPSFDDGGVDLSGCANGLCAPYTCNPQFGVCRTMCESSAECIDGYVCNAGFCFGTECTVSNATMVCGAYACVTGTCAHDCVIASCADGYYCRGDTNKCVPRCSSRTDPICAGFLCDVGVGECEPYCLDGELGCAAGYVCSALNECTPDLSAPPCSNGCGAYACVNALGTCATHCVVNEDCMPSAVCTNGLCG